MKVKKMKRKNAIDEDDLLEFLKEGQKIGEQTFRDRFGYCPRGLLNVLVGTVLLKGKVGKRVSYTLMDNVFIRDASDDEDLELSTLLINEVSEATGISKSTLNDEVVHLKTGSEIDEETIEEFEIDELQEVTDEQLKYPHLSFEKLRNEENNKKDKKEEEPKGKKKSFWQRIKRNQ